MGVSIGVLAGPRFATRLGGAGFLGACAMAADVPDLARRFAGQPHYNICHSVPVNLIAMALVVGAAWLWPAAGRRAGGRRGRACIGAAWLSHMLLDSMYNHGRGGRYSGRSVASG